MVTVELLAPFVPEPKLLKLNKDTNSLKDVIDSIEHEVKDFKQKLLSENSVRDGISILLNGINIQLKGNIMDIQINDTDTLVFCISVLGG